MMEAASLFKGTLRVLRGTPFSPAFFCSNNPLRKGFEKLLKKMQLCSRVRPRNDQFHVRGSVDERQFRIPQKEYWQKPSDGWTSY